ncbi:MAG: hypothetical protein U0169_04420 [Polyangiaceae bacterium]
MTSSRTSPRTRAFRVLRTAWPLCTALAWTLAACGDSPGSDVTPKDGSAVDATGEVGARDAASSDGAATGDASSKDASATDGGADATVQDAGADGTASDAGRDATLSDGGSDAAEDGARGDASSGEGGATGDASSDGSSSTDGASNEGGGDGAPPLDEGRGQSCQDPLSLASRVALREFLASDPPLLAMSGDPTETVPDGSVGLVRSGAYGHALALRVGAQSVVVPGSEGALDVVGGTFGGSGLHVLAFSKAQLTARARFGGKILHDVGASGWSLEIRVIDPAGQIVASRSLPHATESVLPLAVEVKAAANTASLLVQLDERPVPGGRIRAQRDPSPVSMQVVDLVFASGTLTVDERPSERVTESDMQYLADDLIAAPTCPEEGCGPILDAHGRVVDCGGCVGDEVCAGNMCHAASALPNGCIPKTSLELCGPGACGRHYDGCTAMVDCGGCANGFVCGQDEPGVCGDADTSRPEDVRAAFGGTKVCGCFTDEVGRTVEVACDAGEVCTAGVCHAP